MFNWASPGLNQKGFTLVELLVAVAIIGILTGIAVPNYVKYQRRARQAQAKLELSSIYVAEKNFRLSYSTYTTCLPQIGVTATADTRYYAMGFPNGPGAAIPSTCGVSGTADCDIPNPADAVAIHCPKAQWAIDGQAKDVGVNAAGVATGASLPGGSPWLSRNAFKAKAAGNLGGTSASPTTLFDTWSIDNQKNLINDNLAL